MYKKYVSMITILPYFSHLKSFYYGNSKDHRISPKGHICLCFIEYFKKFYEEAWGPYDKDDKLCTHIDGNE